MEKKKMYKIKGKTTSIAADIKITLKVRDNYISVSGHEERAISEDPAIDMDREWEDLWDSLFVQCDEEAGKLKASVRGRK